MAPSLKAVILIIAATTLANAGMVHISFFSDSNCGGSVGGSADAPLFKAFNHPSTLNGPCVLGYFEPYTGNHGLKPMCPEVGKLHMVVYKNEPTGACEAPATTCAVCNAGTNNENIQKEYYVHGAADLTAFTTANGTTDNNNKHYGGCVQFTSLAPADSPKTGSVQISRAANQGELDDIAEAAGTCSAAPAPGSPSPGGAAGSAGGANGTSGNGTTNGTTMAPKATSSKSARAHGFLAAQLVASAIAAVCLLN